MIKGKESFIKNISRCLGRDTVPSSPSPFTMPSDVQHQVFKDADKQELKDLFRKNSEVNGTLVFECAESELAETLLEAIASFEEGRVIVADHSYLREQGVITALQEKLGTCHLWDMAKSREVNMENAETARVGITMAECGLAESGTVILFSHKGSGRSVSLLPAYSITVIKAVDLRPRLTQGMEFLKTLKIPLPASINFVSGASATADIELVHVKGVHGPVKIAYIVVE